MKSPFHFHKAAKMLQPKLLMERELRSNALDESTHSVKKSCRYSLRVFQLGGLSLLSSVAGVLFGVSPAQAAPVTLQFSGATCETNTSGTASGTPTYCLTLGSVWRFPNVITGGGSQRDALVTIATLSGGATLATIDDTANGTGPRFQPSVISPATTNITEYAKFNIRFVAPGTTTSAAVGGEVYETAFDIDGDGQTGTTGIREFTEFSSPVSSTIASPTFLTANTPVISAGDTGYIVALSSNSQAGIGTGNAYKATALYNASTTSFDLYIGAKAGSSACSGGACARLSSVSFDISDVVPLNDVVVTKAHTGNFSQGQTGATYSLTVSNFGALNTSGTVTVVDTIPTGLTATAASGTGWTCTLNQPTLGQVQCTRSDALAFGSSYPPINLTVNVATTAPISVTNSATVSGGGDYYTGNNTATDPTTINGVSDLTISKAHTGNFTDGTTASYALTVGNAGGAATSGTITLTDTLPTGLTVPNGTVTLTGTNAANWSCSATNNVITCTSSTAIAASGSSVFNLTGIQVGAAAVGSVTNTVTVSGGGETNTANDSATDIAVVSGVSDLTLAKTHSGNFTYNIPGTYTLNVNTCGLVNNIGSSATSGTVTVTDTLPTGLTVTNGAVTLSGTNALSWSCTASNNVITCTSSVVIAASGSSTFNLTGIQVGTAAIGSVTNTAAVSGGGETKTNNNAASDPTTVIAPDLTLSKTHTGNFIVGTPGSYTLTVSNSGTASTSGTIMVTDTLPTGLTVPNGTITLSGTNAANWTCTASNNVITCTSTTAVGASGSSTFTLNGIQVSAAAIPSVTNTAAVTGGNDGNTANNSATDPTTVNGFPDLTIIKTHTGNFAQGQTGATYSLTVMNSGTAYTSGTVTVVDTLPTGLTATAASGTGWTCTLNAPAAGQVQCTRSDVLTASSSYPAITLTVNVASNAAFSVTNTVTVSGGGQTNTGNDIATDPTTVNTLAHVLLVKRITEINGNRTQNPNNTSYPLNQVLDHPGFTADDAYPANNWPSGFLLGAYDAGPIKPGDIVEYTVYFMNSNGSDAANVRFCDRLVGVQQFVSDAYGAGQDIEYKLGTNPVQYLTQASATSVDRAELNPSTGTITGCPAPTISGTNNGTVVLDVTGSGSSGQQSLTTLPGATAQGTPTNSYGYFRFKTKVNP